MARGKKNRRNNKKKNLSYDRPDGQKQPYQEDHCEKTIARGNLKMEAYYALQGIHDHRFDDDGRLIPCATAEEKNQERLRWRKSIGTILPASFRTAYDIPESLKEQLEAELAELITAQKKEAAEAAEAAPESAGTTGAENDNNTNSTSVADSSKEIIRKIPFLPHAYQLDTDRKSIRKDPTMKKIHWWLRNQTDAGFITRQETVSMVPPVVLAPQPDDVVFDMCAAPGSKTCQILEKLSPKGALLANDANPSRAGMLVHQLRRIMHNNPVVLVTSCDAQFFPHTLPIRFDRVLADVPCSGDGTSRKNIGIWKGWNQLGALALHSLQLDIAWKGAALLKVGGYMCYSTCSHNPVENEAVVAELLRRSNGSLELIDAPLDGFRVRPGISHWKVLAEEKSIRQIKNEKKRNNAKMRKRRAEWEEKEKAKKADGARAETEDENTATDDADTGTAEVETDLVEGGGDDADPAADDEQASPENGNEGKDKKEDGQPLFKPPSSWDEETLLGLTNEAGLMHFKTPENVPKNMAKRIRESCFPPKPEEAQLFHLDKCIRCLPHDNDTGGFFVALLKKVAPISRREARQIRFDKESVSEDAEAVETTESPERKKAKLDSECMNEEAAESHGEKDISMATGDAVDDTVPLPEETQKPTRELKGNRLADENGNKHTDIGRDDFVPPDESVFGPIIEFYGFSESFPKDQIMTRACGDAKTMHYIGASVKENFFDKGIQARVTIVNSGIKAFVKNTNLDADTPYRVSMEGIHFLLPYMTKRKVSAGPEDFAKCISGEQNVIPFTHFSPEFAAEMAPFSAGPVVVLLKGYETDYKRKMFLVMWRCRSASLNCLVSKAEMEGMKSKLAALTAETSKVS